MEDINVEEIFKNLNVNVPENGLDDNIETKQISSLGGQIFDNDGFLKFLEGDYLSSITRDAGGNSQHIEHISNPNVSSSTHADFNMYSISTTDEPNETNFIYEILQDDKLSNYPDANNHVLNEFQNWTYLTPNDDTIIEIKEQPSMDSGYISQNNGCTSMADSSTYTEDIKTEDAVVITDLDTMELVVSSSGDCTYIPTDGKSTIINVDDYVCENEISITEPTIDFPKKESEIITSNRDELLYMSEGRIVRRPIVTLKPKFTSQSNREINELLREIDEMVINFSLPFGPKIKKPRKLQRKLCPEMEVVVKEEDELSQIFHISPFNGQLGENTIRSRPNEAVVVLSSDDSDDEPSNSSECKNCGRLFLYTNALKTHKRTCNGLSNGETKENSVIEEVTVKDEPSAVYLYPAFNVPMTATDLNPEMKREQNLKKEGVTLRRSQRILTRREDHEPSFKAKNQRYSPPYLVQNGPMPFQEAVQPMMLQFVQEQTKPPKPNKPEYICEICSKKYVQKGRFETHMKNHKELICVLCSKSFGLRSEYNNHVKRCGKASRRTRANAY